MTPRRCRTPLTRGCPGSVRATLSSMPARPPDPEDRRDPVVEAYRSGVDLTLIEENLRLSVEDRLRKWIELARFADELRLARERVRP